ncbi:hypothetical protein J6590_097721 [Homalodisca vitripennis]|nr:hypothetical protein J6590_097721 [Homalodisca vitripennis]
MGRAHTRSTRCSYLAVEQLTMSNTKAVICVQRIQLETKVEVNGREDYVVVTSPIYLYLRDSIERVQWRFLRLAGVRLGFRYLDVPVQEISSYLNLPSLEARRSIQDVLFLYKLAIGIIDCPDLL